MNQDLINKARNTLITRDLHEAERPQISEPEKLENHTPQVKPDSHRQGGLYQRPEYLAGYTWANKPLVTGFADTPIFTGEVTNPLVSHSSPIHGRTPLNQAGYSTNQSFQQFANSMPYGIHNTNNQEMVQW